MATKKIKINFKMPTPTAAERLHALQQKNRKAAGLPDPSEYKKKLDSMKKENYEEDDGPLSQEQLDEISSQLKASYVSGAKKQIKQSLPFTKKTDEYRDIAKNFIAKRQKGIAKANEEVELLDEMPESSMKTRDVHSHLKKSGWELARSKGGHDVYKHPKAKHSIPVPRHNQLKAPLIRGIMKASKVEEGVTLGRLVGRGNIYQYDRNPGPRDGSELEHVPFHAKTEKQKKLQNALNDLGKKMKETHPKLREAKDSQEYDYEGDMAKSDLRSIMHHAKELHDMLDDDTNLAEWCQSKITLAEDYLSTVANYMRSEMNEGFGPNPSPNKTIVTVNGHNAATHNPDGTKKEIKGRDVNGKPIYHSNSGLSFRKFATKADGTQGVELHVGTNVPKSQPHPNSPNGAYARKYNEETVQEDKNDYQRKIEKNNKNFIAASKRQKNPLTNVHTAQTKQKPVKEEIEIDEMVVIKTNKPIGTRVADIGPGGKEYNVKTNKAWDDSKKKQPQGADFAAQRRKERLAKSGRMDEEQHSVLYKMKKDDKKIAVAHYKLKDDAHKFLSSVKTKGGNGIVRSKTNEEVELDEKKNLPGLWANIHAKRKRGESPAKPGDKDYPKTLNIESAAEPTEGEMKGKQGYSRKAQIVMNAAKGKKSDSPDKFQKDPELSSEIHKT